MAEERRARLLAAAKRVKRTSVSRGDSVTGSRQTRKRDVRGSALR